MRYAIVAIVVLVAGCGGASDLPDLVEVNGKVTLDGEPLAGARVMFVPKAASGNSAEGTTNAQGEYKLIYSAANLGAAPGDYEVMIVRDPALSPPKYPAGTNPEALSARESAKLEADYAARMYLPARYNELTTLAATVAAESATHDFALTSERDAKDTELEERRRAALAPQP
ncbi:MAG: carboxypeptidase-like regulatory domain-containing protein [Planctomycetaceae bacterium]